MPTIGEIKYGYQLGKATKGARYSWLPCLDCGKLRWVKVTRENIPASKRCSDCGTSSDEYREQCRQRPKKYGPDNPGWKGGRIKSKGYILIRLAPNDFFYPMVDKSGYVREHRLVVAKALNRCLLPWEIVHHKGTKYPSGSREDRGDNRYPENLALLSLMKRHLPSMIVQAELKRRDKRIAQLEKQVKQLQDRVLILEAENIVRVASE